MLGWTALGAACLLICRFLHPFTHQVFLGALLRAGPWRLPGEQTQSLSAWTWDLVLQIHTDQSITSVILNISSPGCRLLLP